MNGRRPVVCITNIMAPYKTLLLNAIWRLDPTIEAIYLAETDSKRRWPVERSAIQYRYRVLCDGRLEDVCQMSAAWRLWEELEIRNPGVVIVDGYQYAVLWVALLWAMAHRRQTIIWTSSTEADRARQRWREWIKGAFVRACNAANVYGSRSQEYLERLGMGRERIRVMGNTTDNAWVASETMRWRASGEVLRRTLGVPKRNFLFVGRLAAEKNVRRLLEAYGRLGRGAAEWGLIVVGDGPEAGELGRFVSAAGLDRVRMPGFVDAPEIPRYLAVSDVLVLPSASETWGLVVNEAMAAGLAVLVSDRAGCCPELVREGINGFRFDAEDADDLARYMIGFVDGTFDSGRFGEASRQLIASWTPERAARAVLDTVDELVTSRKGC